VSHSPLVRSKKSEDLRTICGESRFGFVSYYTAALPDRLYVGLDDAQRPTSLRLNEPELDVTPIPTPLETLLGSSRGDALPTATRQTVRRLEALWLLVEDRYRLLDALPIEPLRHQASLVEHILSRPELRRVLIADEVGLGKTIEVAVLIQRLQEASGLLRVLYLTEAQLVDNVCEELSRLGLRPRRWTASVQEARLAPGDSDPLVVASIHRAVFQAEKVDHLRTVSASGPWDVIVIDEAHHLSDWSEDGHSGGQRIGLVRKLLSQRLVPDGRVVLLTGTPHQGHQARFVNLLKLLSEKGDPAEARGRVFYRIKDDVRDWDGEPLFPLRDVRPPTVLPASPEHREWMRTVHDLLAPGGGGSRAAGWRRAQALEWCASSAEAGLAYLLRLALRSGISHKGSAVCDALSALRPYRGGSPSEPIDDLAARMVRIVQEDDDLGDVALADRRPLLDRALDLGARLARDRATRRKLAPVLGWLKEAPEEKVVIFAQPVETVLTLRRILEEELGLDTALHIVGGQSPEERQEIIRRFVRQSRPRALVSSRSGGEGINLQVSRHLVHFDVPWNPMEMEQRVGRVHRFGSVRTVRVDTLVLEGSREQRVLARCRARLGQIVRDLDPARFELLFARTMARIPLEELAELMVGESFGPLQAAEENRLDQIVTHGLEEWKKTDGDLRKQTEEIQQLHRGPAREDDFEAALIRICDAKRVEGWSRVSLQQQANGEAVPVVSEAKVYRVGDVIGYVGRDSGVGLKGPEPQMTRLRRLGLSTSEVAGRVRAAVGGADERRFIAGHGALLVSAEPWAKQVAELGEPAFAQGALFLAYLIRYLEVSGARVREVRSEMRYWAGSPDASVFRELDAGRAAGWIRWSRAERAKKRAPDLNAEAWARREAEVIRELRTFAPGEPIRAVFPVAALWLEPASERESAPPPG
jgi:superfamily II DNA or RNA helicase